MTLLGGGFSQTEINRWDGECPEWNQWPCVKVSLQTYFDLESDGLHQV